MESRLRLSTLPGELQELIILNLHPSAAVALRQTNRYFQAIVSLDRYNTDEVRAFLQEREQQPHNASNLACYSCLCLKPRSVCLESSLLRSHDALPPGNHILPPHHPYSRAWRQLQSCVDCAAKEYRILPGNVVDLAEKNDKMLFCIACLTLQCHFCKRCRWCMKCVGRRTAKTYRKDEMGYRVVPLFDRCWEHHWHHNYTSSPIIPVKSDRLLRLQAQAVRVFETTNGGPASVEWFDKTVWFEDLADEPAYESEAATSSPVFVQPPYKIKSTWPYRNHELPGKTSSHGTNATSQGWRRRLTREAPPARRLRLLAVGWRPQSWR